MSISDGQAKIMGENLAKSMGNLVSTDEYINTTVESWTTNFYEEEWEKELDVGGVFIGLDILFVVLILVGNGSVFFLLMKVRRLHTVTNYYIASLCVSDICVGVFAVPMEILTHYNEKFMSNALCQGLEYFVHVSIAANVYCLIIIAVDRHRNIVKPFLPKLKYRQCVINILIVWFISILQGWSAVVLYRIEVREHIYHGMLVMRHECTISDDQGQLFLIVIWFNFLSLYLIPLAILTGLYAKIFTTFYLSRMRVGAAASQGSGKRRKRIVRMLAAIVMIFAVCQCPMHVWRIIVYAGGGPFNGYLVWRQVFDIISFSNSWVNVVIYVSFNESFRRAYKDTFRLKGQREADNRERTRTVSGMPSSFRPSQSVMQDFADENSYISTNNRSTGSKSSASLFSRNHSIHSNTNNPMNLSVASFNRRNLSVSSREVPNGHLDSSV